MDRYLLHDLVRAHATDAAIVQKLETERRAALTRLLDHYLHAAAVAMDCAYPYEREHRPPLRPSHTPAPDLSDPTRALRWLDTELPNLLAITRYAAAAGWLEHTWQVPAIVHRHLRTRGRFNDAQTLHQQALTIARAASHRPGELNALTGLGEVHRLQGRYTAALAAYSTALEVAQQPRTRMTPVVVDAGTDLARVAFREVPVPAAGRPRLRAGGTTGRGTAHATHGRGAGGHASG